MGALAAAGGQVGGLFIIGHLPGDLAGVKLVAAEAAFKGGQLDDLGANRADFFSGGRGGGGDWRNLRGGSLRGVRPFGDILAEAVEFGELMAADGAALGIEGDKE